MTDPERFKGHIEPSVEVTCSCNASFLGSMEQVERLLAKHPCTSRSHLGLVVGGLFLLFVLFLIVWFTWPPG